MMDFDSTSPYPSAMYDEISVYPEMKNGFAFKPQLEDVYVKLFKVHTFNQDGDESILKIKY